MEEEMQILKEIREHDEGEGREEKRGELGRLAYKLYFEMRRQRERCMCGQRAANNERTKAKRQQQQGQQQRTKTNTCVVTTFQLFVLLCNCLEKRTQLMLLHADRD